MTAEKPFTTRPGPASLELSDGGGILILDPFSNARAPLPQRKRRVAKQLVA